MSKKQSSIAKSTTEAEMIALATAIFSAAEILQGHIEEMLGAHVPASCQQDN